jgi:hypothetical protein
MQCDYKTKIKKNLAKHTETTHEDGQIGYTCKYCSFHANQRQLIFEHMVVHPNARKSRSKKLKKQIPNTGQQVTEGRGLVKKEDLEIKVEDELC